MTYSEFVKKWIGKGIDYDGKFGYQCVDVYRMYVKEVLGVPQSPPVVGAKDIWDNYLKEYFDRIENTIEAVPQQGDVIIWSVGSYGHIAICDSATKNSFTSFEQNWVELNGTGVTELRTHNYNNVLGWLHFNSSDNNMDLTDDQKRILQFLEEQNANEGKVREAFGALKDLENCQKENDTLRKFSTNLSEKVADLTDKLAEEQKLTSNQQKDIKSANKEIDSLKSQIEILTKERCVELKNLDKMSALEHLKQAFRLLVKKNK